LRDVLREMRVAGELAQRGGVDEVDVTPDELSEGRSDFSSA